MFWGGKFKFNRRKLKFSSQNDEMAIFGGCTARFSTLGRLHWLKTLRSSPKKSAQNQFFTIWNNFQWKIFFLPLEDPWASGKWEILRVKSIFRSKFAENFWFWRKKNFFAKKFVKGEDQREFFSRPKKQFFFNLFKIAQNWFCSDFLGMAAKFLYSDDTTGLGSCHLGPQKSFLHHLKQFLRFLGSPLVNFPENCFKEWKI